MSVDPYRFFDAPLPRPAPRGLAETMQCGIGGWIDEGSLVYEAWRTGRTSPARLRERAERYRSAIRFLEGLGVMDEPPRLFSAAVAVPRVERARRRFFGLPPCESIRFESPAQPIFPADFGVGARDDAGSNHYARAYHWRAPKGGRPAVICIHGYRAGFPAFDGRAFGVPYLFEALGLDVALATLPFHGARTPRGFGSGQLFLNDALRTIEAVVQAIADLRALARWLRAEGAPSVGVCGMSLGGYVTALFASLEPDLDFAIPIIPASSFADIVWHRAGRRGEHDDARDAGIDLRMLRRLFSPHCPLHHRPLPAPERRVVIAAKADRIVPPEHAEALAAHWQTRIEWFAGGHLTQLGRIRALGQLIRKAGGG